MFYNKNQKNLLFTEWVGIIIDYRSEDGRLRVCASVCENTLSRLVFTKEDDCGFFLFISICVHYFCAFVYLLIFANGILMNQML
jgi:hypothetical protein